MPNAKRRTPNAPCQCQTKRRYRNSQAARMGAVASASRSEGKRRATEALISDPPLSLVKEGLQAGYTEDLENISSEIASEALLQQLRGVFAAHDDDNDGEWSGVEWSIVEHFEHFEPLSI